MLPACQVGGRDHVDRAARRPRARPGAVIEAPAVRVGAAVDRGLRLIEPLIPRRSSPMKRRELLSGLAAAALAGGCTSQASSTGQTSTGQTSTGQISAGQTGPAR